MSEVQTATQTTGVSPESRVVRKRTATTALHQCLVVSPRKQRAREFEQAAGEQGWETIVARDVEDAAREAVRNRIQLAVIDLESAAKADAHLYRELVEQLAARTDGPLMVVCGAEEDAMGEIWSRQLGVWMYLPGVDDQSDIAMVCGEARNVVEKLRGNNVVVK